MQVALAVIDVTGLLCPVYGAGASVTLSAGTETTESGAPESMPDDLTTTVPTRTPTARASRTQSIHPRRKARVALDGEAWSIR